MEELKDPKHLTEDEKFEIAVCSGVPYFPGTQDNVSYHNTTSPCGIFILNAEYVVVWRSREECRSKL